MCCIGGSYIRVKAVGRLTGDTDSVTEYKKNLLLIITVKLVWGVKRIYCPSLLQLKNWQKKQSKIVKKKENWVKNI